MSNTFLIITQDETFTSQYVLVTSKIVDLWQVQHAIVTIINMITG